ncbi:BTAD domain-containing putative transcriptional regulator [Spongiactinospora sp. TRM90649]|uniref:AfsR/SARP family transcriptional regulator n=1 Tax=Spongiactinospora sp. TRM90649 TaxID=3031114 RepID=UPI0023F95F28|nr:BTAD domain-containing putative transcriptional regulator [Spongiactinospora sp. TRM90649]MDF5756952.1 BTAD domain-containing putative transcriptional regulator [Spongiactinospora sp. TRM90649]
MEFRVLGPVEVWQPGGPVATGGFKQRSVLALLVLNLNRVVTFERMIDQVWGTRAPDARNTVQRLVSRLRRVIEAGKERPPTDGRPPALETHSGGYLLRADPSTVDLYRFESLIEQGRTAQREGDHVLAATLLGEGLRLWRGPALVGVADGVRDVPAARLEEARLLALEDRIEADLASGPEEPLVAELRELVADHPLRERMVGLLMVALHRCGRQAEALEVYQRTRGHLVEELGLEPGQALQRTHREVLAGDLGAAGSPRTALTLQVPAQLPADVPDFTGRAAHVHSLVQMLRGDVDGSPVVVTAVGGGGGVGKTTLAIHVGHLLRDRFPDGQLHANLHGSNGSTSAAEILGDFLRALGADGAHIPEAEDKRATLYRSMLAGQRVLVVLDNARDAAQVRPLLPGSPTCAVLVTSRARMADLEGVHLVDLDVLPAAEAVELLGKIAGPRRVAAEPEAALEVAGACGNLPLAVRVAGARLAARPGWSLATLAERLADERRRLDELRIGDLGVRASFELSYRSLPPDQAKAFRMLGVPDSRDITLGAGAALLGVSEPEAEALLESLVDAYLIETREPGRYQMHDLMRTFARQRAGETETQEQQAAALQRLLEHYLATARQVDKVVGLTPAGQTGGDRRPDPLSQSAPATRWLQQERANLVGTILQTTGCASIRVLPIAQLVDCMGGFLGRGFFDDWEAAAGAVLDAALREHDQPAEILARNALGILAAERRHDLPTASRHLHRAWRLCRDLGDRDGLARALNNLGAVCTMRRRYRDAVDYLRESLALRLARPEPLGVSAVLNNLGTVYVKMGAYQEADVTLRDALGMTRAEQDHYTEANTLNSLGNLRHEQGDFAEAVEYHERCLDICRRMSLARVEMLARVDLAAAERGRGDLGAALGHCVTALRISHDLRAPYAEARTLRELGHIRHGLGEQEYGDDAWQRALKMFEEIDAPEAADLRATLDARTGEDDVITR